jgi:hypothetical protein
VRADLPALIQPELMRMAGTAAAADALPPVIGLGHSLGAKLLVLLACGLTKPATGDTPAGELAEQPLGTRAANVLVSYNNFPAARSVPLILASSEQACANPSPGSCPKLASPPASEAPHPRVPPSLRPPTCPLPPGRAGRPPPPPPPRLSWAWAAASTARPLTPFAMLCKHKRRPLCSHPSVRRAQASLPRAGASRSTTRRAARLLCALFLTLPCAVFVTRLCALFLTLLYALFMTPGTVCASACWPRSMSGCRLSDARASLAPACLLHHSIASHHAHTLPPYTPHVPCRHSTPRSPSHPSHLFLSV